jgi:hypothetical protein
MRKRSNVAVRETSDLPGRLQTTSFPFFTLAKSIGIDYGDTLLFVDCLKYLTGDLPSNEITLHHEAALERLESDQQAQRFINSVWLQEQDRRERVQCANASTPMTTCSIGGG